jgi:hypothetical protein
MSDIILHDNSFGGNVHETATWAFLFNEFVKATYALPTEAYPLLEKKYKQIFSDVPISLEYLKDAVFSHIGWLHDIFLDKYFTEKALHNKFKDEIESIMPGAKILDYKYQPEHIPDFMVTYCGDIIPVEIKLGRVAGYGLKQLRRYMDAYHSKKGILVAEECKLKLRSNITFIELHCSAPEFDPYSLSDDTINKIPPIMQRLLGLSFRRNGGQVSIDGIDEDGVWYNDN